MPIRTIIFDFGNVLAFFDHGRAVARLAKYSDLPPVELTLQLYGSPIEDAYERGAIDTAEYVRLAKLNGRLTCTDEQFLAAFVDIFWRNDEVCDLVPRLRPKYRLMLASNTNRAHFERYYHQFHDVLVARGYFDALCTSDLAGARKPEEAFFRYVQRGAVAAPHECLFIDDLPGNVEAAEKFGWRGIVYRPDGTLEDKLRAAGVEIGTK
jgi:putative hydrolase of the HAD superfamily